MLAVVGVPALPVGALGGIVEDDRGLLGSHAERGSHGFLRFGVRALVGIVDGVRVRFAVTGAQDNAVFATEFATEVVKGKRGYNFGHSCDDFDRPYMLDACCYFSS